MDDFAKLAIYAQMNLDMLTELKATVEKLEKLFCDASKDLSKVDPCDIADEAANETVMLACKAMNIRNRTKRALGKK